ncbi:hypothetical protein BC827DRAFT_1133568 [Russula dissimulans]|nr:hypothetical protein BC827DRAFT_1133568 [Russula dissimulans]
MQASAESESTECETECGSPFSPSLLLPAPSSLLKSEHNPSGVLPQQSSKVSDGGEDKQKGSSHDIQTGNVTLPSHIRPTSDPLEIGEAGPLRKKFSRLREIVGAKIGNALSNCGLNPRGANLGDDLTLTDYDAAAGDSITIAPAPVITPRHLQAAPKKPVIYLYPPSSIPNVTVDLHLTSCWQFSAVYPSPQTTTGIPLGEHSTAQSLTWAVAAEPDGTLVERTTGVEISYLYWEARTAAGSQLVTPDGSRAASPVDDTETFDPSRPSVDPGDSVVLPIGKVAGYLDTVLKALTLHTEARTSFITYWLPDLLKHEYIALRFLSQASYERAAEMHISPTPDVVTRVFMLFRGVAKSDIGLWEQAAARASAEDGGTFWARVVGVDAVRAADDGLFRVLEWGGMEIE